MGACCGTTRAPLATTAGLRGVVHARCVEILPTGNGGIFETSYPRRRLRVVFANAPVVNDPAFCREVLRVHMMDRLCTLEHVVAAYGQVYYANVLDARARQDFGALVSSADPHVFHIAV